MEWMAMMCSMFLDRFWLSHLYRSHNCIAECGKWELETWLHIDPNTYWYAIPSIGSLLKGLAQGRNDIISFLSRRRYKEMTLAHLEKKHVQMSPLDMRFHLHDLIGSGHLGTDQAPTGLIIRVSKI
ncbi:unnamed protein product [Lupinus luteus]|uniref:Uncharacterized protein n=1 Tax=Lupinus luteus TaxID=3873 RepID=A0AAV1VS02_LUPLU